MSLEYRFVSAVSSGEAEQTYVDWAGGTRFLALSLESYQYGAEHDKYGYIIDPPTRLEW